MVSPEAPANLDVARPVRVTIIGGGVGGMAAAYELLRQDVPGVRFQVRVLEQRSFLGGKGGNVRSADGELRIEEHGLHVWLGFYFRAFRMLADVYAQLGLDLNSAFEGTRRLGFGATGDDVIRTLPPKHAGTVPWDQNDDDDYLSPSALVGRAWEWLKSLLDEDEAAAAVLETHALATPSTIAAGRGHFARAGQIALQLRGIGIADGSGDLLRDYEQELARTYDALAQVQGYVRLLPALSLMTAIARTVLVEELGRPNADFSKLDNEDIADVLARHGASPEALNSPVARGYLDLVFTRPRSEGGRGMAAGTGIHGLLLMIAGYRGFPAYKMKLGMGEVVFAPLYRYLKEVKHVEFVFGAHVDEIVVDDDRIDCLRVRFDDQLEGVDPLAEVVLGGQLLHYWKGQRAPIDPERLAPPDEMRDFDELILAVPPAAQRALGAGLRRDARYARMLDTLADTATVAYQAWWDQPVAEVANWGAGQILCALPGGLGAFADMSHLLGVEKVPSSVLGLTYHCDDALDGAAGDPAEKFREWLGEVGIGAQPSRLFCKENQEPSDRYVLSPAGTTDVRLDADGSRFERLTFAGDWTRTSLPAGCVECAVESGLRAAKVIVERRRHVAGAVMAAASLLDVAPRSERMGLRIPPGPYRLNGVRMQSLVLGADRQRLQALVDRLRPRNRVATMVVPFGKVMLAFVDAARTGSSDPAYDGWGHGTERDVAFWIPVCVDGALTLFAPWLWVDDPLAIAIGREVYGFNKLPGRFREVTWSEDGLESLEVTSPQPGPGGQLEDRPLLHITRSHGVVAALDDEDRELVDRYGALRPPSWLTFRSTHQPGPPWGAARAALTLTPRSLVPPPPIVPHASRYEVTFGVGAYDLVADLGLGTPTRDLVNFSQTLELELGAARVIEEDLMPEAE